MSSSIADIQEEIIAEFAFFETKNQIYDYLIDLGKSHPVLPKEHKIKINIIKGCQSKVWIKATYQDGRLKLCSVRVIRFWFKG